MGKPRNRRLNVKFPVFGLTVTVIFARDIVSTCRRLQTDATGAHAIHIPDAGKTSAGWIVFGQDPDADTIAHEASHAIRSLFAAVGARACNEGFAYHLGFLVGRIDRFLKGSKQQA